jgi:hypothetical protein
MADIKIGDRVRVVRVYPYACDSVYRGYEGIVKGVDPRDTDYPYDVTLDDGDFSIWVHEVESLAPDPVHPSDRDALVARAKEHLAGTEHTADDIIRLAEFLAG